MISKVFLYLGLVGTATAMSPPKERIVRNNSSQVLLLNDFQFVSVPTDLLGGTVEIKGKNLATNAIESATTTFFAKDGGVCAEFGPAGKNAKLTYAVNTDTFLTPLHFNFTEPVGWNLESVSIDLNTAEKKGVVFDVLEDAFHSPGSFFGRLDFLDGGGCGPNNEVVTTVSTRVKVTTGTPEFYDLWKKLSFDFAPCTVIPKTWIVDSDIVATGDPHFTTWGGEKFDFHGVCDLVLLQNPQFNNGLGMDIHVRTKKTRMWSYIESAVVRIGKSTLEVMGGKSEHHFWMNKIQGGEIDQALTLSGYTVTYKNLSSKAHQFKIDLGSDGSIILKTWNSYVSVHVKGVNGQGSAGLMGSFPMGTKVARDGKTIIEDINAYGQEWQVRPTESQLFQSIDGPQAPEKCEIPSATEMRRRLGESLISREDAEAACSRVEAKDYDLCVFDVLATNDKDMAGAY